MKNILNKKRAIIGLVQIIGIIGLVLAILISLIVYVKIDFAGISRTAVCQASIKQLALTKSFSGQPNCQSEQVCISGGKDCSGMDSTVKYDIDLEKKNVVVYFDIYNAIIKEHEKCALRYGVENGDFVSPIEALTKEKYHCGICAVVEFDESIQNQVTGLSYKGLMAAMTIKPHEGTSAFSYLYGLSNQDYWVFYGIYGPGGLGQLKISPDNTRINASKKYSIVAGVQKGSTLEERFAQGTGGLASFLLLGPVGAGAFMSVVTYAGNKEILFMPPLFAEQTKEKIQTACDVFDFSKA